METRDLPSHLRMNVRVVDEISTTGYTKVSECREGLLRTFFDDSPTQAVAAILDRAAGDLSEEQLDELEALIRDARRKGR